MCRMLNMSDSVEEVRAQLGLTEMSKISFQDFLHCRARVMLQSNTAAPTGLHRGQVVVGGPGILQPQQYANPHHLGVLTSLPPPTVMMSGVGTNLPTLPHQNQHHHHHHHYQHIHPHYSPGGVPPVPISLPSSLYPYPHQPATDSGLTHCQPPCLHSQHQQPHYAAITPLHQRYPSPKQATVAGGSGEDTGIDSDATGGNVATGHQLTSWPTLSSDSLGKSFSGVLAVACSFV